MTIAAPFAAAPDGLRLAIRLTPRARAERIIGLAAEPDGKTALKIAVTAPPVDGKANEALLRLLAQSLGVPRRDITLVQGAADRRKLVHVAGNPMTLARHCAAALAPWLADA